MLLEANDEWQLQHRYMQVEAMAELAPPIDRRRSPPQPSTPGRLTRGRLSYTPISTTLTDATRATAALLYRERPNVAIKVVCDETCDAGPDLRLAG